MQLPAEDLILRSLPTLSDHLLTHELESALSGLIAVLEAAGKAATAAAVRAARDQLAQAIGGRGDSRHLISRRSAPDTAESRKSGPSPTPS